jgi:hypothetical protein
MTAGQFVTLCLLRDVMTAIVVRFEWHGDGIVTVTGGVQRVGEGEPRFMRRQPHLASGRLLRL